MSGTSIIFLLMLPVICAEAQYTEYRYKRKNHSTEKGYVVATREARYISAGLGLHANAYFGDLTPDENYFINGLKVVRPGVSGFVSYNFNPILFFTGEVSYGRITGDDFNADPYEHSKRKYTRNLHFRNDLLGMSLRTNVNVFRDPFEYFKRRVFNLYFFSGITLFVSTPKAKAPAQGMDGEMLENAGEWVALRPLGTEGQNHPDYGKPYSVIQFGVPFGGGLRFRLNRKMDMNIEGTLHYFLTDYIDDIGSSYADIGVFDNELARALSDRSMEPVAVLKEEPRDAQVLGSQPLFTYESKYDGNSYTVFKGFEPDEGLRGGDRNDIMATLSIKFSYIFTR